LVSFLSLDLVALNLMVMNFRYEQCYELQIWAVLPMFIRMRAHPPCVPDECFLLSLYTKYNIAIIASKYITIWRRGRD
jgi:hypothetical protein